MRTRLAKQMAQTCTSATVIEQEFSNTLMIFGSKKPPNVYKKQAFRDAKSGYLQSNRMHEDTVRSLLLLASKELRNTIHMLSLIPFHFPDCTP